MIVDQVLPPPTGQRSRNFYSSSCSLAYQKNIRKDPIYRGP